MYYDGDLEAEAWFDEELIEEPVVSTTTEDVYPYVDGGYYPQ